jgi:hypothetical protein
LITTELSQKPTEFTLDVAIRLPQSSPYCPGPVNRLGLVRDNGLGYQLADKDATSESERTAPLAFFDPISLRAAGTAIAQYAAEIWNAALQSENGRCRVGTELDL